MLSIRRANSTRPLAVQNAPENLRPFVHPLLAPDGEGELTENEPGHHRWQHGLYTGMNDVNGFGFWEEGKGKNAPLDGTFHPAFEGPAVAEGNIVRWAIGCAWRTPRGEPLLHERQAWRIEDHGHYYLLDVSWTLTGEVSVSFGQSPYGGLFLRMPYRKEVGASLLVSTGAQARDQIEQKRAEWVALSLPLPDRTKPGHGGLAMFDHPANPGHPAPWRVDSGFGIAPSRCIAGPWSLAKGESATLRYRLVAFIGAPDAPFLAAQFHRFAIS